MNEINSSWRSRTQKSDWIQGFHYREIEQVQFQELEETKPMKNNFNFEANSFENQTVI